MKSDPRAFLASIALATLAAVPVLAQEEAKHSIRLGLKAGDVLEYRTQVLRTTKVESPEAAESQLDRTVWETWEVKEAADGAIKIQITTKRISEKVTGEAAYEFESEGADLEKRIKDEPEIAPIAGLVGRSYTVTVSPEGEVRSVEGLDEYLAKVKEALADLSGDSAKAVRDVLEKSFTTDAFRQALAPTFAYLTATPQAKGGTWTGTVRRDVSGVGTIVEELPFTLADVDATGKASVTYTAKATFEAAAEKPDAFKDVTFEVSEVQGSGSFDLDTKNGWTAGAKSELSWKVRMTLKTEPVLAVDQTVKETTTVVLEKGTHKEETPVDGEKKDEEKPADGEKKEEEKKEGDG
ncbi:MAG: hypothetical protein HY720_07285 [Planctomycetes bacterium]|nr:hypothetical protein [Planctomycetota bacterium]